jgi:hypothetical protein
MANLLLTMLPARNIPATHFASSTGPIEQTFGVTDFWVPLGPPEFVVWVPLAASVACDRGLARNR